MPYDFLFPDVGEGIAEGEIVKWLVKEGDKVNEHDVVLKIETDKAVVEIPSPKSGTISKIYHKEGDTVKVGERLFTVIEEQGEPAKQVQAKTIEKPKQQTKPAEKKYTSSVVGFIEEAPETPVQQQTAEKVEVKHEHVLATPAVRRLARDSGVDLSNVSGTGVDGRITEDDVRKSSQKKSGEEVRVVARYDMFGYIDRIPLKGIRKAIAKHMEETARNVVPVTSMEEADVTELWKVREKEKVAAEKKGVHLTFIPFIAKACIRALKDHLIVNSTIDMEHEEIVVKKYFNIGMAVDTENGLVVPVIKGADQKSMVDIAREAAELAEKARNRTLDLMDMRGGTFTITNIGSIGGTFATPVINYPEAAILLTGAIRDNAVARNGKLAIRKILPLSLTFDHRIFDGAEAARFLNDVKKYLEDPDLLLVEE
ncbi:MAG TPA: dihydrolipoamide acetyltransferase family protein [archaeon]|nr:dihydrolipoamide acetyltransferase family protein [archaeon]